MKNNRFDIKQAIVNQQVHCDLLADKGIELFIKRADKTDSFISGNKLWKLKYNFQEAKKRGQSRILTFGGAFSNHILATAVAGKNMGFQTIGIIRGDELGKNLSKTLDNNFTLRKSHENGMILEFVSREDYRKKHTETFIKKLKQQWGDFYLVPEGGTNSLAVKGCSEILTTDDVKFHYICVAVGTGATIAGLINSAKQEQQIMGFPALKGDFLKQQINRYVHRTNWVLQTDYHFGGYGKYLPKLIQFINQFKKETSILLDPIYTGKMLFGVVDLIAKNKFPKDSKILVIHTGGLQTIIGFNKLLQKKKQPLIAN